MIRARSQFCRQLILRGHIAVTENLKSPMIVRRKQWKNEPPHRMPAKIRRHIADPQPAIDAVLDALETAGKAADKAERDDPASDKTLSPFFCSPVNK